ncbi:MAG TPA: energy transducer TonB [Candidatus Saccharimonadales bacterium]|nr:energy transducer TonB [Candidatus Saccharimonadales bacterium]
MKRILTMVFSLLLMLSVAPVISSAQTNAKAMDEAVAVTEGITPPRLSEVASPDYTAEAKKKKIEGTVTLLIVVDKKGDVVDAKVVKGLGYGLDENAIIAVKEWKYKPAEKDDQPIAVKLEVTVDFYLRG